MFQPGEIIIYGNTGVCKVLEITHPKLHGVDKSKEYYVLSPLFQDGTIYSPIDNPKVFMRPVISRQQANELIDMIPGLQARPIHSGGTQQLSEQYQEYFSTHNCSDLLELIMSLYAKKQQQLSSKHKVGQIDERYMRKAEDLLYGELAVALELTPKEVPAYIAQRMKALESAAE